MRSVRPALAAGLFALVLGLVPAQAQAADDPAGPLRLAFCDDLLQPPRLFRCRVVRTVAAGDFARGPCALDATVTIDGAPVASVHETLDHLGQLAEGADLVFAPALPDPGAAGLAARLDVVLSYRDHDLVAHRGDERCGRHLLLPTTLARTLAELGKELAKRQEADPQPWLWLEQGRELALSGLGGDGRALAGLDAELTDWLAGRRPPPGGPLLTTGPLSGTLALRDPRDGSVQPVRWHRPAGGLRALALWCGDPGAVPAKSAWPPPPAAALAAALAAGVAVEEVYPAGDRQWDGVALDRACDLLNASAGAQAASGQDRPVQPLPLFLVGSGRGATAALRLAGFAPPALAGVLLIAPRFGDAPAIPEWTRAVLDLKGIALRVDPGDGDPAPVEAQAVAADDAGFWSLSGLSATAEATVGAAPHATWSFDHGPLAAYARGPFVVVVGTGESQAAHDDAAGLARSFVIAWARHAHGYPPVVLDRDFRARDWRGRNLVLVGNPRANAVLGDLVDDGLKLPVSWDFRTITMRAGTAVRIALRSERRPLALALPDPRQDGRTLLILDGAPWWPEDPRRSPLPLAGLPDGVLGDPTVDDDPGAPPSAPGMRLRRLADGPADAWVELASGAAGADAMMPTR